MAIFTIFIGILWIGNVWMTTAMNTDYLWNIHRDYKGRIELLQQIARLPDGSKTTLTPACPKPHPRYARQAKRQKVKELFTTPQSPINPYLVPKSKYVFDRVNKHQDILHGNLGVHLKYHSQLEATRERILLHINVNLPNITQLTDILDRLNLDRDIMRCDPSRHMSDMAKSTLKILCKGHYLNMGSLQLTVQSLKEFLDAKMDILQDYLPQIEYERFPSRPGLSSKQGLIKNPNRRHKRVVGAVIVYSELEPRIAALEQTADHLDNLKNLTLNIENQLTILTETVESEVIRLEDNIIKLSHRLHNLTLQTALGFREVRTLFTQLSEEVNLMRFLSNLTHMDMMLSQTVANLQVQIVMAVDTLINGIHTLETGLLPDTLVAHSQLKEMLQQTNEELYKYYPDYTILRNDVVSYYKIDNVLYLPRGHSVVIQLPIFLKEKNQERLSLYRAVSYHVPYSVLHANKLPKGGQPPSYTRLDLDYQYIAVGQKQYILLNENHLRDCVLYKPTMVCQSIVLQTHNTVPTCLAAMFWNVSISNIAKLCQLKYYFGITPPANTFEDHETILIANVKDHWSIFCRSDTLARKIGHEKYAIIHKNDLCHCKIVIGHDFYIQQQIHGCSQKDNIVNVHQPVNALVTWHFQEQIKNVTGQFDYFATHDPTKNITAPELKVLTLINETDVLLEPYTGGVKFERVKQLIKNDTLHYKTVEDKLYQEFKNRDKLAALKGWHLPSFWSILGISGTTIIAIIAVIIVLCLCCRQGQSNIMSKIMTGMSGLAMQNMGRAEALKVETPNEKLGEISDQTLAYNEFKYRMFLLASAITAYLIYKFMVFIYNRYLAFRIIVPQISGDTSVYRCHVYLEVVNEKRKVLLYVASIAAAMVNVTFCADTRVKIKGVRNSCLSTLLELEWESGYFKLFHDVKCMFPNLVKVPFYHRMAVTRMVKTQCHGRILIFQDVYYSLHPLVKTRDHLSEKEERRKKKLLKLLNATVNPQEGAGCSRLVTDLPGAGSEGEPLEIAANESLN